MLYFKELGSNTTIFFRTINFLCLEDASGNILEKAVFKKKAGGFTQQWKVWIFCVEFLSQANVVQSGERITCGSTRILTQNNVTTTG